MSRKMKTAKLYAPSDLRIAQVPTPKLGRDEVLLKVKAGSVCSSDISRVMKMGIYRYPTIPGHELSGEVVACGLDVKKAKMPEKVTVADTAESEIIVFVNSTAILGREGMGLLRNMS